MRASHSVPNMPEYAFDRILSISWILNMPGFLTWQGSEYAKVTQGSKYVTIRLNISE